MDRTGRRTQGHQRAVPSDLRERFFQLGARNPRSIDHGKKTRGKLKPTRHRTEEKVEDEEEAAKECREELFHRGGYWLAISDGHEMDTLHAFRCRNCIPIKCARDRFIFFNGIIISILCPVQGLPPPPPLALDQWSLRLNRDSFCCCCGGQEAIIIIIDWNGGGEACRPFGGPLTSFDKHT